MATNPRLSLHTINELADEAGDVLAVVADDVRSPFAEIILATEHLIAGGAGSITPDQSRVLDLIAYEARRGLASTLRLSRRQRARASRAHIGLVRSSTDAAPGCADDSSLIDMHAQTPHVRDPDAALLAGPERSLEGFLRIAATVGAAVVDRDGTIAAANDALCRLLGEVTSLGEATAKGQEELVRSVLDGASDEWRSSPTGFVAPGGRVLDCRLSVLGSGTEILAVIEPLYEPADRLNAHLLELNDELIASRRALAAGNRRLRELDEVKNLFIASATHDLKTPITGILGWAELLGSEVDLPAAARAMVVTIESNARRLTAMIDDLLGAALIISGELRLNVERADVAGLVAEAVTIMQPVAAAAGSALELDAAHEALAEIDRGRVFQILDNLLSNAVKYSPAGGTIHVACHTADGKIVVSVADSGIGISQEDQSQLFSRFFRADAARARGIPGTGLGLANARSFAEAHGGSLSCTSKPGAGSTFELVLPMVDAA